MKQPEQKRRNDTLRNLPFHFSGGFYALFGLITVGLLGFGHWFGTSFGIWAPLVSDALIVLLALVDYFVPPHVKDINVVRPLTYPLIHARSNQIDLEVTNRTGRRVRLRVKDDFPQRATADPPEIRRLAEAVGPTRLTYSLSPAERGDALFGDINFWMLGALGLVWKHGVITGESQVKIYPEPAAVVREKPGVWKAAAQRAVRPHWKKGTGTEFDSLRDYVVGDDTRLIQWTATARKGRPIVRENRVEQSQNVFIVLDAGRMMTARVKGKTKMDYALNAALMVAYAALQLGDRVGLMAVAQDILCFVPQTGGSRQFGKLLDSTYSIAPRMEEPRFMLALSTLTARLRRRSLVILFTDLIDRRASEGLLRYTIGMRPRHLPLVVAMSDLEVVDLADSAPRDADDLYRQGVAAGILARRERLMAGLSASGTLVMDAPPDRLSAVVVDRYLDIKTKGLL